jgi:rfaE bifunctional protein nucleotidyltransferase chain/domain
VLRDALAEAAARRPLVWDPHPRGGAPVAGARLVTPSQSEARTLAAALADGDGRPAREPGRDAARAGRHAGPEARSRAGHAAGSRQPAEDAARLVRAWGVGSVAVTLGERGALLSHGDRPLLVSTPWRASGDPCGAGDRFATAAAGLLADGVLPEAAVQGAVAAATRYVEEGGVRCVLRGGPPADAVDRPARHAEDARAPDAFALAAAVRARGGTVVAAGGCFDLLHAGHITLLEAARRAGDCLIVCVNSDASVRRRKGAGRPLVPAADRVRVLTALGCVDAVAVFAEDTPESLLRELRPDVWAKGADYGVADLPEAALLESWGGQVVLLPYLDGRSTSVLAERAARAETRP